MITVRTRIAIGLAASISLVATPAMARGWHRNRDRVDGGAILAGVLVLGGIAAIAASASKSKRDRQDRADGDDRYDDRDYRSDYRPDDDRSDDYRADDYRDAPQAGYGDRHGDDRPAAGWRSNVSTDQAVDACVAEVERGSRSIEGVESVNREGEGWRVEGRVSGGSAFSCAIDGSGRVRGVSGI